MGALGVVFLETEKFQFYTFSVWSLGVFAGEFLTVSDSRY